MLGTRRAPVRHAMDPLDRPIWASLTSHHATLARGDARAWRYRDDVNLFGSARDDSEPALEALARLVTDATPLIVLQVPPVKVPPGLECVRHATGVQMIATTALAAAADDDDIVQLGAADAEAMLGLATLTQPGPFLLGTHRMGRFVGIRRDGRLAAMAGERFRFPGYTEVSAVCTHPDYRGHGLAMRLSRHVAAHIAARGDTAFLHAWKDNAAAIALYRKLGFRLRGEVDVAMLGPTGGDDGR